MVRFHWFHQFPAEVVISQRVGAGPEAQLPSFEGCREGNPGRQVQDYDGLEPGLEKHGEKEGGNCKIQQYAGSWTEGVSLP